MTDDLEIPKSIEAEQALIGAVLVNNDVYDRASIRPEHFYDPLHARIWSIISHRIEKGLPATPVLLRPALERDPGLAEIGGPAYLVRLAGAAVSIALAPAHADQIRGLAFRRDLLAALRRAQDGIASNEDPDAVASVLEAEMMVIHDRARPSDRAVSFAGAAVEMIDRANEAYQKEGASGLTTGIAEIDNRTGGMVAPEVWVLGGRASMGKTAVALHIALSAARSGAGVLFASLEMDPSELSQRMVSSMCAETGTRVPYTMIRKGTFGEEQFRAIIEMSAKNDRLPMEITSPSLRSIGAIMGEVRACQRRMQAKGKPLGLIVVDYLQKVQAPGDSSFERITNAMTGMKEMAVRHGCPVLVLAQLNREVEARANQGRGSIPRPRMSDLKGSGEIEQDADVILLAHRDEYYLNQMRPSGTGDARSKAIADLENLKQAAAGKMDLICAKFRNGPQFEATVDVDLPVNLVKTQAQNVMDFE